jgi:RNA polymerase sigma-54 factor
MALGPRLDLRQSQHLVMTPQLRQAIKLLQFSNLEVSAFIEEELERNPLLERDESHDPETDQREEAAAPDHGAADGSDPDVADLVGESRMVDILTSPLDSGEPFDSSHGIDGGTIQGHGGSQDFDGDDRRPEELIEDRRSLRDQLGEQVRLNFSDPRERLIGACLIAMLDPAGRLSGSPEDLAASLGTTLEQVEAVRRRMQLFDPVGMFCRDLKECLAVQLADRNRLDPAMRALLDNLDVLARRDLKRLMQLCAVDAEDLADMIAELRCLDPKPGATDDAAPLQPLVPDVLMRRDPAAGADFWRLELNPDTLPRLLVNQSYHALITPAAAQDRAYLSDRLQNANWLIKSLQQRAQTILKVSGEIVRRQDAFFRRGVQYLRPLILRDVADAVDLHESTVSRVTANKYIATPRGTFELKFFFTTAIAGTGGETHSAEAVRHRIRTLVGAETATSVLSDDAIVSILRREGVDIARRTVAKYREALRIPSSVQRKRDKVALA